MRNKRSLAGLISSAAGFVLLLSAIGALPAAAATGDIWTQPAGTPEETSGHSQEVHLPCGSVDVWADGLDKESGTWVLSHLPPPNPPGPGTEISHGTYHYSGVGIIATIPISVFLQASGPHFKVEIDNDNNKSKTFWLDCVTSLTTTPQPSAATIGATLKDRATLGLAFSPAGTITFNLYKPDGSLAHAEQVAVNGNGDYLTPTGHVADVAGTWHWQAVYSGDGVNAAVTSKLADEPVTVSQAQPTIATTPNPTSALVGDTLNDAATLGGGYQPTGAITFTLLDPNNTPVHTESVTVSDNGSYSTAVGHVAGVAGTWHWKAEYSGDANNKAAASDPASEPVVVREGEIVRVQPTISTVPNPAAALVGATLKDSATLAAGNDPQGTITFTLLDPSNTPVHTEEVSVDGNGDYSTPTGHVAGVAGTWHWKAEYSGDAHNLPAASDPASEPVVVSNGSNERVQPTISTTPSPSATTVGGTLKDIATLGGGSSPTGSITFTLYNQAGLAVHSEEVAVHGNGAYSTPHGHIADVAGTWHWTASYSGDANNLPVASRMADEPVTVGPAGGVLAATGATIPGQALGAALLAIGLFAILGSLAWRRREL